MTSSKTAPKRKRDKAFYLDLIKKRFTANPETGFVGLPGVESLAQNESQLRELDLVTLKAIAHAARNLLKATATHRPTVSGWGIEAPAEGYEATFFLTSMR